MILTGENKNNQKKYVPVKLYGISSLRRGEIGSLVFWNVTQRRLVAIYGRFGKTCPFHPQGPSRPREFFLYCLAFEDGTDRFSRNVGKITTIVHYVTSQKHEYLSATLPVTHFTLNGLEVNLCFRIARPKTNLTFRVIERTHFLQNRQNFLTCVGTVHYTIMCKHSTSITAP